MRPLRSLLLVALLAGLLGGAALLWSTEVRGLATQDIGTGGGVFDVGSGATLDLAPIETSTGAGPAGGLIGSRTGARDEAALEVVVRVSPDGPVVPHAPVCVVGRAIERAVCDERGRARFRVKAGDYYVGADPPEGSMLMAMPLVHDAVGDTAEVEVTVGAAEVVPVELFLQPASFLTGRIVEPNGAPVFEELAIEVVPIGPKWMPRVRTISDPNGFFESPPLFAGTYVLSFARDAGPVIAPTTVELAMGERRSLTLGALVPRKVRVLVDVTCGEGQGATPWPFPFWLKTTRDDELRRMSDERYIRSYGVPASVERRTVEIEVRPGPYVVELYSAGRGIDIDWIANRMSVEQPVVIGADVEEIHLSFVAPEVGAIARVTGALLYTSEDTQPDVALRYRNPDGETQLTYLSELDDAHRFEVWVDLGRLQTREVEFVQDIDDTLVHLASTELVPGNQELDLAPSVE